MKWENLWWIAFVIGKGIIYFPLVWQERKTHFIWVPEAIFSSGVLWSENLLRASKKTFSPQVSVTLAITLDSVKSDENKSWALAIKQGNECHLSMNYYLFKIQSIYNAQTQLNPFVDKPRIIPNLSSFYLMLSLFHMNCSVSNMKDTEVLLRDEKRFEYPRSSWAPLHHTYSAFTELNRTSSKSGFV